MRTVDLNCDMGEGFGHWRYGDATDDALMEIVSSANVATGYHAGDPNIMNAVAALCAEHGVGLGAHPGYADRQGFGRRAIAATSDELVNDIIYQLGALREFGRRHGIAIQHVKPHGALFMTVGKDAELARALVDALRKTAPDAFLYCLQGFEAFNAATAAGQPVVREFYADRDYDRTGNIVFARKMRVLDPAEVADKCVRACTEGKTATVDGGTIDVNFESICFHSDTPGALAIGKAVREGLTGAGITIAPPAHLAAAA
ncbi:5-oxoprolinase subunit PxpA [Acuticoccus sp. MNP-M23]|uniref:5-oxoprolinase subunit PxpA n=1 Tax=Acuticoccus sp. MNP-M23 TaxID=3072793 RepID=UPI00281554BD|nr:5-oxoprolinase subunit PxpA [Acuticoccus sp. MNP-M23]WMS41355.1 5-oxoprolinase subunit PxpA [Acuticoccus sp. MNP-M23]